jgi:formylglycine-generating enzyme required for sulfatase activity
MARIDTGVFLSGEERKSVWLPAFYLDVTPTTNTDYARFVAATGHRVPGHWVAGKPPVGIAAHPVVGVTYADAQAYAAWAGKTLPTSEEWEKAARGTGGIDFPWGNHRTPARCNVRETGLGHTTPVTRYHSGISPSGIYDMSGNVWEWCSTETAPGRFVLRGSAFTSSLDMARTFAVNDAAAGMLDEDTGFRCACTPGDLETALAAAPAARA